MSIIVSCDCGKKFKAKDDMAGRKVRCPGCRNTIRIPGGGADSSVAAAATRTSKPRAKSSVPVVDEKAALLKYEAAQKQKQMDAETEAAYRAEQQKLIASYDQLAGKATTKELETKKKKEELISTGVKKPTVATKAADAAGTFLGNPLVKYIIIVSVLGGLTYGSVMLVKFFTTSVDQQMTSVKPRSEQVNDLMQQAREAIAAKDISRANKCLDEVVRLDPPKEKNRTYLALRQQVADLAAER